MNLFVKIFISSLLLASFLNAQGYICAVGGGPEDNGGWSDEPYDWMVEKGDSGKVIILSYGDATSWLPNYFVSLGASSSYNKKISSRASADLQSTYDELITAKVIFLRGGDQWQYVNLWKGTKTEDAISYVFENGGVIAGTSAGAMVLGEIVFSAQFASPDSKTALTNPTASSLSLDDDFLKLVPNVLFDTHVAERGRHGRLIAMMYKYFNDKNHIVTGCGVDDKTALCINSNGIAEVMGTGSVSIFTADEKTVFSKISSDFVIENLKCDQLTDGWKFDLNSEQIAFIPSSAKAVDTSRADELPLTDIWLTGSDNIPVQLAYSLDSFLGAYNPAIATIISYPSFSSTTDAIASQIISKGYAVEKLLLTNASLNDDSTIQKMNAADAFVFAGDDPSQINLLNDTTTAAGLSFVNKINSAAPVFMFGSSGKTAGKYFIDNTDNDNYAAYEGRMTFKEGLNLFGDLIFQPKVYADNNYYENRVSSVLWGLMRGRSRFGIYADGYDLVRISNLSNSILSEGLLPLFLVDASSVTYVDSSQFRMPGGIAPRQIAAMNNLRYSLTSKDGLSYSLINKKFDYTSDIKENITPISDFVLHQNYPNPFNPDTKIKFTIPPSQLLSGGMSGDEVKVTLKVFDILGRKISTLLNDEIEPGTYQINFSATNLPSGVYFYSLISGNYIQTQKMILLR